MRVALLIGSTLMLTGCLMVGPNYERPCTPVPEAYTYARNAQDQQDLACWWSIFGDSCLNDLIAKASCGNYDVRRAIERIEQVAAQYRITRAQLFPLADGVIETNRRQFSANLTQFEFLQPDQRVLDFLKFGFDVLWEIDVWGRLRRANKAAYADYQAQIEDARAVYIMLLSDVASAYIDLRALARSIALRKERIKADRQLLMLQMDRYSSGLDSNILVQQTKAELENAKSLLASLEIIYAQTLNGLAVLVGELPEAFNVCEAGVCGVPRAAFDPGAGMPSELIRRRPDIRRAEREIAASSERIGEAMADFLPRFNLLASVATEASDPRGWFASGSLNWFVGQNGRWPLVNFGRVTYNIDAKKSIYRQALLAYCQTVVKAFADVEDALVAFFTQQQRVEQLTIQLQAAQAERNLVASAYEAGLRNQSDLVLAEKNRIIINELLIDAQRAESLACIAVYKALGGGWEGVCDVSHST